MVKRHVCEDGFDLFSSSTFGLLRTSIQRHRQVYKVELIPVDKYTKSLTAKRGAHWGSGEAHWPGQKRGVD